MNNKISELSDIQSEAGIIGTLIENPEYILYAEQLTPRHFFDATNGCLFWAISELYKSNIQNIDSYNLFNVINTSKAVKRQIGEKITSENISDMIRLSKNVARRTPEEYLRLVKIVLNNAFKRNLVENLDSMTNLCFQETEGIELYQDMQRKIDTLTTEYIDSEIQPFSKIVRVLWDESRKKLEEGGSFGYKPLISELEKYFK